MDMSDINVTNNDCQIDEEILFELADLFKVFGDSTRIRIMNLIADNELAVSQIS